MLLALALLACHPKPVTDEDPDTVPGDSADSGDSGGPAPTYDPAADPVTCNAGGTAPLLEAALADAALDRDAFGYTASQWDDFRGYNDDAFQLSWYTSVHHHPEDASCWSRQLQADLDAAAATPHPVAALIGAYAPYVDAATTSAPVDARGVTLADALAVLAGAAGGGDDPAGADALPPDLADALTPIVLALAGAIDARHALDASADSSSGGSMKPSDLYGGAGGLLLGARRPVPDIRDAAQTDWFMGWYLDPAAGPRVVLLDAARRLAFAVEDADLGRFAGQAVDWSWASEAGVLRVAPATSDVHAADEGPYVLLLETGGDDTYAGSAGGNENANNPVSVLVDLGGDDTYGYDVVKDDHDAPGLLPSDGHGRASQSGYYVSTSDVARQGSGVYGIGLLFDAGAGADRYTTLRAGQGYGAFGVGVLADDGGDDVYAGEAAVQGAGNFGVGILYDAGGNDTHTAWAYAEGFGYVGSGGLAYDREGADTWWADPGNSFGGTTLYYSPQLTGGEGNSSMALGSGYGLRGDSYGLWWSGGLGTLRDAAGDDTYTGGVFSEATGYWLGTGVLADGDGDDAYDALWYIQGGAAHFALAILDDGGGDDAYNLQFTPYNVSLGSGHDFSVGIAIDESGNDTYRSTTLSMGASNCQGLGVFVDNDGADTYRAGSTYGYGLGNHSTECAEASGRMADLSTGLFMDAGGDADTYEWPDTTGRQPGDDSAFGIAWAGTSDEHGGAVDGDGESNFHAR